MTYVVAGIVLALIIGAFALRNRCYTMEKPGVGEVHMHSWPYWGGYIRKAWFMPVGTNTAHEIDSTEKLRALQEVTTVEQAMAVIRA